jgi:hypothetical protein
MKAGEIDASIDQSLYDLAKRQHALELETAKLRAEQNELLKKIAENDSIIERNLKRIAEINELFGE